MFEAKVTHENGTTYSETWNDYDAMVVWIAEHHDAGIMVWEEGQDLSAERFVQLQEDVAEQRRTNQGIAAGMDSRAPYEYNADMCRAISAELDRLGWSSDTAPEGNTTLDAFPTEEAGIVVLADNQETTAFHSEPLYRVLVDLPAPISYDDLWHAILPHMVTE